MAIVMMMTMMTTITMAMTMIMMVLVIMTRLTIRRGGVRLKILVMVMRAMRY